MQIIRRLTCPKCDGKKLIRGDECPLCKGSGKVLSHPKGEAEHGHNTKSRAGGTLPKNP